MHAYTSTFNLFPCARIAINKKKFLENIYQIIKHNVDLFI
jgi:hypothetical protein